MTARTILPRDDGRDGVPSSGSCLRNGVPSSKSCLRDSMPGSGSWLRAAAQLWIRYHSKESMKTSASKGRSICHTLASVHGICFMPFEVDLSWRRHGSGSDITLKNP